MGNVDAVFVIKIFGALSTSTYSKVVLINGTLAKNVYWLVSGAVSINDYSLFKGTIICNNGAINLNTGVALEGRALTTTGALGTTSITAIMPPGCGGSSAPNITMQPLASQTVCAGSSVSFSVIATGTGLTYQWRKGTTNMTNGGNISGATSATLTINPVNTSDAAPNYNVVVSGTFPPGITSNNASLLVNSSPVPTISGQSGICINSGYYNYSTEPGMANYVWNVSAGGMINYGSGTNQIQVSWINSGPQTVSINYSNGFGCSASTPTVFNVTVNSLPNQAGLITGTASVCNGTNDVSYAVALIPNAMSYVWTLPPSATIASGMGTNSITVNYGTDALSGNIYVSGNNLCGNGMVSPGFAVTVKAIPATPVVTNTGYILSSSASAGNQWYFEGTLITGATSRTYDATLTGTGNYWSVVTLDGCSSAASNYQMVTVTGINSLSSPSINVYPIPNNGIFTVSIVRSSQEPYTITVFSALGVCIYAKKDLDAYFKPDQVVDIGTVDNGIYTVVIRNNSSQTIRKIVVNN
jgi:hypothetical protein